MMCEPSKQLGYENEIRMLEKQIEYWCDPRIIQLENVSGSGVTAKEIVATLEARIKEIRAQIQSVRP